MQPLERSIEKLDLSHEGLVEELFLAHPREHQENYTEHLLFTIKTSAELIRVAFCLMIHGLVPAFFKTTASDAVLKMYNLFKARRLDE